MFMNGMSEAFLLSSHVDTNRSHTDKISSTGGCCNNIKSHVDTGEPSAAGPLDYMTGGDVYLVGCSVGCQGATMLVLLSSWGGE